MLVDSQHALSYLHVRSWISVLQQVTLTPTNSLPSDSTTL